MVKGALYKVSQPVILSEAKNLSAPAVETRQDVLKSQVLLNFFENVPHVTLT